MAKATILICDSCKKQKRQEPAIGTFDLCATHAKAAHVNLGPAADKPKRTAWNKADYDTINRKILELANARPLFTGVDVCKAAKIKPHIARTAVGMLIGDGKLVATGENRGRRLSKAH